ncbi:hypothetical protein GCM10020216_030130 [Nonomuraea helvata]
MLVSVSTAGGTPSLRMHVWRRLRGLGAVYLQQSVCLLPDRKQIKREIARLLDRVRREGGSGRMLHLELTDPAERDELVAEFQEARDAEYEDLLERLPSFFDELETETARGRATYVEVEESEADLARFRTWLAKIEARDYFGAAAGDRARAELARAADALAMFEDAALSADTSSQTSRNTEARRLHAVEGE